MAPSTKVKFARYKKALEQLDACSGCITIPSFRNQILIRRKAEGVLEAWVVSNIDRRRAARRHGLVEDGSDEEDDYRAVEALPAQPDVVFEGERQPLLATHSAAQMASFLLSQLNYACRVCYYTQMGEPAHRDDTGAVVCWDCMAKADTASDELGCIICHVSGGPPTAGRLVLQCDACNKFTCHSCFDKQPFVTGFSHRDDKACAHCNKATLSRFGAWKSLGCEQLATVCPLWPATRG